MAILHYSKLSSLRYVGGNSLRHRVFNEHFQQKHTQLTSTSASTVLNVSLFKVGPTIM